MGVLRAKVGGSWVDIGAVGTDEVQVGATTPVDAAVELWYDTAAVPAVDPAKMPRGYVGYVEGPLTNIGSYGALTLIPGMSFAAPMVLGRRYKMGAQITVYQETSAPTLILLEVHIDGVRFRQTVGYVSVTSTDSFVLSSGGVYVPTSSATQTWSARIQTLAGTCAYDGRFGRVGHLLIEDIGGV